MTAAGDGALLAGRDVIIMAAAVVVHVTPGSAETISGVTEGGGGEVGDGGRPTHGGRKSKA